MVNILVPTDLSDLSKVAVQYAIKIANKLDGTITLLHVINVMQPTRASMRLRLNALEQEMMDIASEDLEALVSGSMFERCLKAIPRWTGKCGIHTQKPGRPAEATSRHSLFSL